MHKSVLSFFDKHTKPDMFTGKTVIEVGSLDVNGSVRGPVLAHRPASYVGIDFVKGKGVDKLLSAEKLVDEYGPRSFDTVISTEMLEHAENWRECVNAMKDVCKTWLIITTRGPGFPRHSYPNDHWRYTVDDFERIFADFDTVQLMPDTDPHSPGVFYIGKKTRRKQTDLASIDLLPAPLS